MSALDRLLFAQLWVYTVQYKYIQQPFVRPPRRFGWRCSRRPGPRLSSLRPPRQWRGGTTPSAARPGGAHPHPSSPGLGPETGESIWRDHTLTCRARGGSPPPPQLTWVRARDRWVNMCGGQQEGGLIPTPAHLGQGQRQVSPCVGSTPAFWGGLEQKPGGQEQLSEGQNSCLGGQNSCLGGQKSF